LAVWCTSLRDRRDKISLHMAVNGFRIVFVVRVRGRMRRCATKREVVNPRTATKITIERFDLASICNFLGEFVDAEMIWEVPDGELLGIESIY
jgi:hypothetical protein